MRLWKNRTMLLHSASETGWCVVRQSKRKLQQRRRAKVREKMAHYNDSVWVKEIQGETKQQKKEAHNLCLMRWNQLRNCLRCDVKQQQQQKRLVRSISFQSICNRKKKKWTSTHSNSSICSSMQQQDKWSKHKQKKRTKKKKQEEADKAKVCFTATLTYTHVCHV